MGTSASLSGSISKTWSKRCSFAIAHSKDPGPFAEVLRTEGVETILTSYNSPKANAFAKRWVKTVLSEVLDWMLVLGLRHLDRILRIYVRQYNHKRSHQGLGLSAPETANAPSRPDQPSP